jgi:hypothetical protein
MGRWRAVGLGLNLDLSIQQFIGEVKYYAAPYSDWRQRTRSGHPPAPLRGNPGSRRRWMFTLGRGIALERYNVHEVVYSGGGPTS